jgi:uncharacterized integral membrane protein
MQNAKLIGILILLALVAVFTFQNTEVINVNFLFWSVSVSSSLVMLASLFSGIIIGLFFSYLNIKKKAKKVKVDNGY